MFNWKEWHHGYLGALLVTAGLIFHLLWVVLVGALILLDDIYQHAAQFRNPEYHSPLHRLFSRYLWQNKWVQRLTAKLDGMFK